MRVPALVVVGNFEEVGKLEVLILDEGVQHLLGAAVRLPDRSEGRGKVFNS